MRFLFLSTDLRPIHAAILEERPLGGGISSIIRLSQALSDLGHEVFVVTSLKSVPPANPKYIPLHEVLHIGEVDVIVAVRGWANIVFYPIKHKKCFYWTGESMYNPKTVGIGDKRAIQLIDALIGKSRWLTNALCQVSGFPLEKTWVLPNGVHLPNFQGKEMRHRKRLIYSSTPVRGLKNLARFFPALKMKHPELELHIFSSFDRMSEIWPPTQDEDKPYEILLQQLKKLPGCTVHKSILQKELAREFMKSTILAYPTNFAETCCNTTLEAQAAGCAIVTTDLASLPETVGEAGILIKGMPGQKDYDLQFMEVVDKILVDDQLFETLSLKGLERAKKFDWKTRALEFLAYLSLTHGIA